VFRGIGGWSQVYSLSETAQKLSRKVDECKPLPLGRSESFEAGVHEAVHSGMEGVAAAWTELALLLVRGVGVHQTGAYTRPLSSST